MANYHSDEWIMTNLKKHYAFISQYIDANRIIVLALRGSQNYGLDTINSDIDSRVIYIPSNEEIEKYPEGRPEWSLEFLNECIVCHDIRQFISAIMHCDIYCLEILLSKYVIIPNAQYHAYWQYLTTQADKLANARPDLCICSIKEYLSYEIPYICKDTLTHRRPHLHKGYDYKLLYRCLRLYGIAKLIAKKQPFSTCMDEQWNHGAQEAKNEEYDFFGAYWLVEFITTDIKRLEKIINNLPITDVTIETIF